MLASSLDFRTSEIEKLIAANELNTATKRVMDFVKDFANNSKRKKEAIDIRASYNALREENRRYGKADEENQELSRLRYRIMDFIEVVKDESPVAEEAEVIETAKDGGVPTTSEPRTGKIKKTKYELDKEAFRKQRGQSTVDAPPDIIFHGKDIKKKYGGKSIDFTFSLPELVLKPGEITAVVGENGNGKTTLLRIIAGQLQINEGSIEYPFLTSDERKDLYSIKQHIAYIPQELSRWTGLLAENLYFSAAIHGIEGDKNEEEVDFIVNRLGLEQYKNVTWNEISGGYKMRFALAKALVWNPTLLILDEPLANLDINTQLMFLRDLRYLADSIANPKAVIISSQNLHNVEEIADNIIFIQNGSAAYNGKMKEFGEDRKENSFEFACNLSKEALTDVLEETSWNHLEEVGYNFILDTPTSVTAGDILSMLIKKNVAVSYFRDISKSTRKLFKLEK